eukprot:scaffold187797_cov17-Prasinocladus_malaysianus.AAC.1
MHCLVLPVSVCYAWHSFTIPQASKVWMAKIARSASFRGMEPSGASLHSRSAKIVCHAFHIVTTHCPPAFISVPFYGIGLGPAAKAESFMSNNRVCTFAKPY